MYQALYRQYRPKNFQQLLGQDHITTILKNQVRNGNIGHAYLFSGTRGTGKTSAAKIFSRAVNCLESTDGNPCNKCENCKEILEDNSMDVIEMDAASNRGIDDIRELRDRVVYPPARIKYKIYIVDEVHMLTREAFNALLKTLEEPPKHLIFILATTAPEKLPQTILSRCQRFDFRRIPTKDIIYNMENILKDLDIQVEDEVLSLIARNSDGAMRDSLSLLDQCISYGGDLIKYEDAIELLSITNKDLIFDLVDNIKERNIENALNTINNIIQDGKDIEQFIKDIVNHFRNLMIAKTTKKPENIIEISHMETYIEQSKSMNIDYILKSLDILTAADSQVKWSPNPRIILEMATIKLVNLHEELPLVERVRRLEEGFTPKNKENRKTSPISKAIIKDKKTKKTAQKKSDEEKTKESKPEKSAIIDDGKEISLYTIKKEWPNIMDQIKSQKMRVYALLIEGEVVDFSNNLLTIGYPEKFGFHQQAICNQNNKNFVEDIISNYLKKKIEIKSIIKMNIKDKETENIDTDKTVQEVVDFFGEDMVEIE